jgi:hypothetical protein
MRGLWDFNLALQSFLDDFRYEFSTNNDKPFLFSVSLALNRFWKHAVCPKENFDETLFFRDLSSLYDMLYILYVTELENSKGHMVWRRFDLLLQWFSIVTSEQQMHEWAIANYISNLQLKGKLSLGVSLFPLLSHLHPNIVKQCLETCIHKLGGDELRRIVKNCEASLDYFFMEVNLDALNMSLEKNCNRGLYTQWKLGLMLCQVISLAKTNYHFESKVLNYLNVHAGEQNCKIRNNIFRIFWAINWDYMLKYVFFERSQMEQDEFCNSSVIAEKKEQCEFLKPMLISHLQEKELIYLITDYSFVLPEFLK